MQLPVLQYPDIRLREKAVPVTVFDANLELLAQAMLQTMYSTQGVGLASIQVARPEALVVIDVSEGQNHPLVLVNPKITNRYGSTYNEEGCLSFPQAYALVERSTAITVEAQTTQSTPISFSAEGLLAICIQHEIDHLNGILFVDYLSALKRERLLQQLAKRQKLLAKQRRG